MRPSILLARETIRKESTKSLSRTGYRWYATVPRTRNCTEIQSFARCLRCLQVLQVTEYAPWKAAFVFLLNVVATFSWNYTDLFIMLLSVSLAQRFKQLNHHLRALKGKVIGWCWSHVRNGGLVAFICIFIV